MFNKGETVRIKPDIDKLRFSGDPGVGSIMRGYFGAEGVITERSHRSDDTRYKINGWWWSEKWLEAIKNYEDVTSTEILDILEV